MFINPSILRSTESYSASVKRLQEELARADAVLIGAGSGLSTSAGFTYSGPRFERYFADFKAQYGIEDIYSGGFYPFPTPEEYWAWWSRHIYYNRYVDIPKPVYSELLELVRDKDYFVLTTNVDHCFQKAGFDKQRLFYTQGDYGLFQCSQPCRPLTYDNEAQIRQMLAAQQEMKIPTALIPHCPICGRPMTVNLRSDNKFVEDAGWHQAARRYAEFIQRNEGLRVLYLELGVGTNTPGIIKYPFWIATAEHSSAVYACINAYEAYAPAQLGQRALCIQRDIAAVLADLRG
ncbi:Uncharacterised protein [uncultured Clostridium sp.]|nr:Uncharacterised protein [uncultured Clostridium sp.]